MGLARGSTTGDGDRERGSTAGGGLIAREIREQRERELQLLMQRQQLLHPPPADHSEVTSPSRDDDVTVTSSSSVGDPDVEIRCGDDVVDGRGRLVGRTRVAHQSTLDTEREGLQKVFVALVFLPRDAMSPSVCLSRSMLYPDG